MIKRILLGNFFIAVGIMIWLAGNSGATAIIGIIVIIFSIIYLFGLLSR
jgi:hypothetical protein